MLLFDTQHSVVCSIAAPQDNHDQDSDSFSLDQVPFGYEQLAQDEDEGVSLSEDEEDEQNPVVEAPPTLALDKSEEIPEDTANQIKSIMSNIQLPDHAIPEWAKSIPESMWLPRYKIEDTDTDTTKEASS
ncbi:hypothetical protein BJV82DRAFT_244883 [Fennellomyces sp. T-0311]|nr:hypothetical protein BJV82DRAFT_244883 [Fennellomyces sp. T-0311]